MQIYLHFNLMKYMMHTEEIWQNKKKEAWTRSQISKILIFSHLLRAHIDINAIYLIYLNCRFVGKDGALIFICQFKCLLTTEFIHHFMNKCMFPSLSIIHIYVKHFEIDGINNT